MKAPFVTRARHERELAALARRAAGHLDDAARARTERDDAISLADALQTELRHAAPTLRRERDAAIGRARTFADRNLRQAIKIERLEHDLAMARDGHVDAATWGAPLPRSSEDEA